MSDASNDGLLLTIHDTQGDPIATVEWSQARERIATFLLTERGSANLTGLYRHAENIMTAITTGPVNDV